MSLISRPLKNCFNAATRSGALGLVTSYLGTEVGTTIFQNVGGAAGFVGLAAVGVGYVGAALVTTEIISFEFRAKKSAIAGLALGGAIGTISGFAIDSGKFLSSAFDVAHREPYQVESVATRVPAVNLGLHPVT